MQDSYLQDTTHFIKFIESANRVPGNAFLVSVDVQPLHEYPTEEGLTLACKLGIRRIP